ncbi:MAG: heme exporter protein CcmB, partial [Deltaproteobacteria bacterium]|nr:heme exporter protein CcmB [Deltaproteobacteria bacterium]
MNWFRAAWLVARKDFSIELKTREITLTSSFFALLVVLASALALPIDERDPRPIAAGTIWITVAFSAILIASRSWAREREEEALKGLLLAPIPRGAIYAGKALASFV